MQPLHVLLIEYGYVALFCVVLVENFGIPVPGQTFLIAAAVLSSQGKLNFAAVLLTAALAAFMGACIGYWLGVIGGRRIILRLGRYLRIGRRELRRMETRFARYGFWFVLSARFFEVLRQLNGIIAGTTRMPLRRFLPANALGAALWTLVWGFGSWHLGRHIRSYEGLTEVAGNITVILLIAALLLILAIFLRRHVRARRRTTGRRLP